MPNPRSTPIASERGTELSVELAREHVRNLKKRRDYVIGLAFERRRDGLRADLEFAEAAAIEWALGIVVRTLPGVAGGR
jgi:hypothetical protein